MNTLATQQRALQHAIVHGGPADALLRHPAPARAPRLAVYRHAYTARLTAALRDNFGGLPAVMGDDAFDALAHAYIAAHPSRHPSIRWFGARLPGFMDAHHDLVPHPALADLARMEWALRSAFDAGDGEPLGPRALDALAPADWPRLVLQPLPSVHCVTLAWAVEPVWRALQSGGPSLTEPPAAHAHTLLVWRQGLETRWRSLEGAPAALLHGLARGEPFASLCLLAAAEVGEARAAGVAVAALQAWLADGLLATWRLAEAG